MPADTTDTRTEEAVIERDIERTQDEMGETVQKLEDSLNPREIARSVMGDENADLAKEAWQVARQNPIPVAMIAVGAAWLLATSNSPVIRDLRDRFKPGRTSGGRASAGLRRRSEEPAPIGPSPTTDRTRDRMPAESFGS